MKYLSILFVGVMLAGCGTQIAYTKHVEEEFDLSTESKIKQVQFKISATVTLIRSSSSGNQGTNADGTLVSNSSKEEERIVIPLGTKGIFESRGENGEIEARFEIGPGKTLTFATRAGQPAGKYFLVADWKAEPNKGGKLQYGNQTYYAERSGAAAYLMVLKKKLHKTKRKDRVVKGMEV